MPTPEPVQMDAFIVCYRCKRSIPLSSDWRRHVVHTQGRMLLTHICLPCARGVSQTMTREDWWAVAGIAVGLGAGLACWWFGVWTP